MMPYADGNEDFWSGYFTSRANSKKQIRDGSAAVHATNKIFAQEVIRSVSTDAQINATINSKQLLLDAMGVNQHHDGISGTAKQHVADDYASTLASAITNSTNISATIID